VFQFPIVGLKALQTKKPCQFGSLLINGLIIFPIDIEYPNSEVLMEETDYIQNIALEKTRVQNILVLTEKAN